MSTVGLSREKCAHADRLNALMLAACAGRTRPALVGGQSRGGLLLTSLIDFREHLQPISTLRSSAQKNAGVARCAAVN